MHNLEALEILEVLQIQSITWVSPGAVGLAVGIDAQEDEQQEGESPQRRAAITEERQRDADHRA